MAGQRLAIPLRLNDPALSDADLFGLAQIRFRESLPPHEPKRERETQVVFANFAPLVQADGAGSGLPFHLSKDGSELTVGSETVRRADLADREITVGTARIQLVGYWPDFVMNNGEPSTKSQEANNPAVIVRVEYEAQPVTRELALELAPDGEKLKYQFVRDGRVVSSGVAEKGSSLTAGWMDWQVLIADFDPSAEIRNDIRLPAENEPETGIPGLRVRLEPGGGLAGEPKWIESGRLTDLAAGSDRVRIGYGLEVIPVAFTLTLLNFEVPRYEGTDTPANFIATIQFDDPATGRTQVATAEMNHPASWPGGFWAVMTGLNYKFSQAEWNPRDLDETTLQVLYDPGWFFKWTGSLAICFGIALMFYWKPKKA